MSNNQKYTHLVDDENASHHATDLENGTRNQAENRNMIIVKVKLVNNQEKEIQIDYNSSITIGEFKYMAFQEQIEKRNYIIKLIYQGKLLSDEKLMKELNLKINPYIHASIVEIEAEQEVDEESINNTEEIQNSGNAMDLTNYLAILQNYQDQIRATQDRMRSDISIQRPRRNVTVSQEIQSRRRPGNNRRALRFSSSLFSRNRQEPRVSYRSQLISEDGNCSDFAWGFILGFIFPLPFIIMILLCRTKRLAKTGLILGFIAHLYFSLGSVNQQPTTNHNTSVVNQCQLNYYNFQINKTYIKMGNGCACSRDKFDEQKEKAKLNLIKAKDYTTYKYYESKATYGPIIAEKYEEGKMKLQSYRPEIILDNSQCSMVTKFEQTFPLKSMTIDEYERRIKKLADPSSNDTISETQILESFKDVYPDILIEGSLIRQLLLNPAFKKDVNGYCISELLLFGNLYCASTPLIRSKRFFEICQEDLPPQISNNDKELVAYVKLMFDISYVHMINLYKAAKAPADSAIPETWLSLSREEMERIYAELFVQFLDDVFVLNTKHSKEDFIEVMRTSRKEWLQPHYLRQQVFLKIMQELTKQLKQMQQKQ
eukprot:403374731